MISILFFQGLYEQPNWSNHHSAASTLGNNEQLEQPLRSEMQPLQNIR